MGEDEFCVYYVRNEGIGALGRKVIATTSVWILLVSTFFLSLISKVIDQFESNFVYISYIQGGNIYVSLRKIQ